MREILCELATRIRSETSDLDRTVHRILRAWQQAGRASKDQNVYLDSVALNLHSFYSGLERLFELIVRHIDGEMPTGQTWRRDLLRRISYEVKDVRPSVISPEMARHLDLFRRFRHLVRNVYATNLSADRMTDLLDCLPAFWPRILVDLLAFATFLEQLAQADNGPAGQSSA